MTNIIFTSKCSHYHLTYIYLTDAPTSILFLSLKQRHQPHHSCKKNTQNQQIFHNRALDNTPRARARELDPKNAPRRLSHSFLHRSFPTRAHVRLNLRENIPTLFGSQPPPSAWAREQVSLRRSDYWHWPARRRLRCRWIASPGIWRCDSELTKMPLGWMWNPRWVLRI